MNREYELSNLVAEVIEAAVSLSHGLNIKEEKPFKKILLTTSTPAHLS